MLYQLALTFLFSFNRPRYSFHHVCYLWAFARTFLPLNFVSLAPQQSYDVSNTILVHVCMYMRETESEREHPR